MEVVDVEMIHVERFLILVVLRAQAAPIQSQITDAAARPKDVLK
ncbi:MAG: hypothetical protein ABIH90_01125 [Candidatus Aenigmatarchaeota archaeon]